MTQIINTLLKPTHIPWIKEVPEDWDVVRVKNIFDIQKTEVGKESHKYPLLSLTLQGIKFRDIESGFWKFPAEFDTYQIVDEGDLVFCLFDIEETPRTIGLSDKHWMITGAYTVVKMKPWVSSAYYYYLFFSADTEKRLKVYYSWLRNTIKDDNFRAIPIPLPPLSTQIAIANFLDQRTRKISTLISNKKKLINLLKEQKQSIIHRAVTKGIDENTKMKDSGIPWIGEIPENWRVRKLKYCVQLNKWKSVDNVEKKVALENIEGGTGRYIDTDGDFQGEGSFVKPDDVLFGKLRPYLAKVLLADFNWVCVNEILVFTPNQNVIYPNFLSLLCLSSEFIKTVDSSTYWSKMPRAEWGFIGNMQIGFPSLIHQKAIVEYIKQETAKIDTAIEKIEKEITLIEEYRTSLIYQAVTGKIHIS